MLIGAFCPNNGIRYRERVSTANKGPLSILGLGPAADVVLVFGCSAANGTGEPGCRPCPALPGYASRATLTVGSADFVAANLTVANDACGYDAGRAAQSEAVSIGADRAAFARCRILGGQDTLYTGAGPQRSYFADTLINGSCDSIYGDSSSVFERCVITVVDHVTAHGGGSRCTPKADGGRAAGPDQMCGADGRGHGSFYLFQNCSLLKPGPEELDRHRAASTELGRAWGTNSHVVYKDTFLDDHIAAHGWGCMARLAPGFGSCAAMCSSFGPPGGCANSSKCWCQNTTFAEYRSTGPGANPSKRVPWSRQLTDREATAFTADTALRGWTPPSPGSDGGHAAHAARDVRGGGGGHGIRGLPYPLRGWAFPYRFNGTFELYGANTTNFNPTLDLSSQDAEQQAGRGIAVLEWAYCWDRPIGAAARKDPRCKGRGCAVANRTEIVEIFAAYGSVNRSAPGVTAAVLGRGLDECNLNNTQAADEKELAATGFRLAKRRQPETIIAAVRPRNPPPMTYQTRPAFSLKRTRGLHFPPACA